jgi:hypothetical protein
LSATRKILIVGGDKASQERDFKLAKAKAKALRD